MTGDDRRSRRDSRRLTAPMRRSGGGHHARRTAGAVACAVVACCLPAAGSIAVAPAAAAGLSATVNGTQYGMGLIATRSAPPNAQAKAQLKAAAASLPASVDLTADAMPVGNQGSVGSCAAWASDYTALGYWENKQGIAGAGLEPMYTYSQVTGGVDRGSTIEGNLQIDAQQGVDNQADYWQGNFNYSTMPTALEKTHAVNWKLTSYSDLSIETSAKSTVTQQAIETALAAGTPVVIGIPVYDNFFGVTSAENGYYSGPSGAFAGNHAITALGYNAKGLVIENSWGSSWGYGGFATLAWSFVNGYVFDAVQVGQLVSGQPANSAAPTITGSAREGQTLTASAGSWSPAATSYKYQWQKAAKGSSTWTAISGATAATYVPTSTGQDLRVLVTAINGSGQGAADSAAVGPVASGAPVNTAAPAITGTAVRGSKLSVSAGSWSPAATSYVYLWQQSTNSGKSWSAISGATGASYVLATSNEKSEIRGEVTAVNKYGRATAISGVVGPVTKTSTSAAHQQRLRGR